MSLEWLFPNDYLVKQIASKWYEESLSRATRVEPWLVQMLGGNYVYSRIRNDDRDNKGGTKKKKKKKITRVRPG